MRRMTQAEEVDAKALGKVSTYHMKSKKHARENVSNIGTMHIQAFADLVRVTCLAFSEKCYQYTTSPLSMGLNCRTSTINSRQCSSKLVP